MGPLISAALKTSVELKCTCCGSTYEATKSYAGKSKYCSYQCFLKHKWKRDSSIVELTCEGCGSSFAKKFTQRKTRFCTRSCATSGERNPCFGLTGNAAPMNRVPRWHAGLTAKTDPRVRAAGEKISAIISQKIVDGEWNHQHGFVGSHFDSKKCGKTFYCRSSYEHMYLEKLEADCSVASYEVEPFRIPYVIDGSVHNYVPDALVTYVDAHMELVEVKPASLTETASNVAKREAAQAWCLSNGVVYRTITEADLQD